MEIRDLEYFIAIAEEKSISKAAGRLYMAQSSLSQFLSSYEANLGYPLFIRTASGVRLTEAGKLLLDFAYQSAAAYHRVQDQMQDIANLKGAHVILGISSFRGSYLLPPVLKVFRSKYPDIHVRIEEQNSLALEQMLLTGEIDVALLAMPEKHSRIKAQFLMEDEICLIAHPQHPLVQLAKTGQSAGRKSPIPRYIDIHDAAQFEFLLSSYDTILGREARRIFQNTKLTPRTYNENLSAMFAASLAASGQGLAFTYYSSRHYFQPAVFLSLGQDGFTMELATAMSPDRYHSRAALALNQVIQDVLGSPASPT